MPHEFDAEFLYIQREDTIVCHVSSTKLSQNLKLICVSMAARTITQFFAPKPEHGGNPLPAGLQVCSLSHTHTHTHTHLENSGISHAILLSNAIKVFQMCTLAI
jgi:hypothetical protein